MTTPPRIEHVEVLHVPITCFHSYDHAVEVIVQRIRDGAKTFCIAINPEKVCQARKDAAFAGIVRAAHVHICDGVGTALAVRLLTRLRIPRIRCRSVSPAPDRRGAGSVARLSAGGEAGDQRQGP